MAEGEEPLGSSDVSTTRVTVLEIDATVGGVARVATKGDDVEVGLGSPCCHCRTLGIFHLLCSQQLGALEVSPLGVPKKWILKGEAPSHETAWVSAASSILDLWFQ